ncbi:hypothetical protein ACWGB8_09060 [Kitasatospora sp. NPDC054939]
MDALFATFMPTEEIGEQSATGNQPTLLIEKLYGYEDLGSVMLTFCLRSESGAGAL